MLTEAVEEWAAKESAVFWQHRMETGYLNWLGIPSEGWTAEGIRGQVTEQLRRTISFGRASGQNRAVNVATAFSAGVALTRPSTPPEKAEAHLIRRIREAMLRGIRGLGKENKESSVPDIRARAIAGNGYIIGLLANAVPQFEHHAKVSEVASFFDHNPNAQGVVIVKERKPLGVIMRDRLYQQLAGQFGHALYASRPVELVMDRDPLIVDEQTPLERVSQLAMSRDDSRLYDIVVTVNEGVVRGAATIRDILECMTALRTEEARRANPLTGLPGNSGIEAELSRLIAIGDPFAVVYADLDYFKWFNDCFGFARGDELIRYLADLLVGEFDASGSRRFFVGHIGGDDFIGVVEPEFAESICERLIRSFDLGVRRFYGGTEVTAVENRQGQRIEQDGVSLSLSLLYCEGNDGMKLEDISVCAARLKKRAKSMKGSVYVASEWKNSQPREK
nr:GGDEF domain-containing protein [Paenibacillus soyae]